MTRQQLVEYDEDLEPSRSSTSNESEEDTSFHYLVKDGVEKNLRLEAQATAVFKDQAYAKNLLRRDGASQ